MESLGLNMSKEKEIEFYSAKAHAWFSTKLEYDKSLLFLSAGGIGLLMTLLTAFGVSSITLLIVFVVSILSFTICLFSLLFIFTRNATHLEALIAGNNTNDSILEVLDSISLFSFILGVILTLIIGISTATNNFINTEMKMVAKNNSNNSSSQVRDVSESFNGANKIAPVESKKSFNNAQNVAPPAESSGSTNTSTESANTQSQSSNSDSSNK